jgi:hypothetical protein
MAATGPSLIDVLSDATIVYAGDPWSGPPFAAGQYALARVEGADILLVRDPLGCCKLFYGPEPSGALVVANRIDRALAHGVVLDGLASVSPGHLLRISAGRVSVVAAQDLTRAPTVELADLDRRRAEIDAGLSQAFEAIVRQSADTHFVVCLSGGLDSTLVADFACRYLGGRVSVASYSSIADPDYLAWLNGARLPDLASVSADFRAAREIARMLDVPFIPVLRPPSAVLAALRPAIALCQDYRDFNVHCAIVNLFLAESIRASFPGKTVAVLTGDLMNEYVCDYQEERIDGTVYYRQPRVPLAARRRFLIRGLDAGDREIGVFGAFALRVYQVYAAVAVPYLRLPADLLADPKLKHRLNGPLLRPELRNLFNLHKQRAQVGGPDGGTLGILHRYKVSQDMLRRMWAESLPEARCGDNPWDIIQVGRYRTAPRAASVT